MPPVPEPPPPPELFVPAIVICSVSLLLELIGSLWSAERIDAVFFSVPLLACTVTVKTTVAAAFAAIEPIANCWVVERRSPRGLHGVHESYFRPFGRTSLRTTLVASSGPAFETWIAILILSPCFGLELSTAVRTSRSATAGEMVRSTDAVLLAGVGSVSVAVMVTVFVIVVSSVAGSTTASNVAVTVVAFATAGMVHVQVLLATAAVPAVGVAGGETGVRPVGSTSVTTTFVASITTSGLVTVTV